MISPIVFNNIYKGALGEEVVKALFIENGIPISNIEGPKIYEKFDFVINENEKTIYIDVKNFSETSMHKDFANEGLSEKLNKKINSLKPDCVAIINLIDEFGEREFLDKYKIYRIQYSRIADNDERKYYYKNIIPKISSKLFKNKDIVSIAFDNRLSVYVLLESNTNFDWDKHLSKK